MKSKITMAKSNKITVANVITQQEIQTRIFEIRGERVMLDRDLAELYGVETKVLNQAVKRNIERFPKRFMFQLGNQEFANLKSQIVTASWGGSRTIPYAFTEQGVAMLSAVLKSPTAIQVSIAIMDAFVQIRRMIVDNHMKALEMSDIKMRLEQLEQGLEENLEAVNDLSEDMRGDIDNIYQAIGELSVRQQRLETKPQPKPAPIGYDAIAKRREKE